MHTWLYTLFEKTMTQEDKELLIKDLSARLYYRPTVLLNGREHCILCGIDGDDAYLNIDSDSFRIESIKPYLRPMLSMTEEEKMEYRNIAPGIEWNYGIQFPTTNKMDWLNAHHFDYRGLIEKGLALEAKEGIYEKKKA